MESRYIKITLICFFLIALLLIAELCFTEKPKIPEPERSWDGPKAQPMAVQATTAPEYEMYFTEEDIVAMAKMLWGEARGCTVDNQRKAVWCVLNRVDDRRFPDTIIGVLSQPYQFHGYSDSFPVKDELYAVALDVLTRWSMEKQGACVERELPSTYLWFTGDGIQNHFREAY